MKTEYTLADTNKMSWDEFGDIFKTLTTKVDEYRQESGVEFDVVAPLLRSGGIPGMMLAVHLRVINVMPVQFKWHYHPSRLEQMLKLPEPINPMPRQANILVCEGNTASGETSVSGVKLLKRRFPEARFYLATIAKVYGGPEELEGFEKVFWGIQTDENFECSEEDQQRLGLRSRVTIFPWEDAQAELADINAAMADEL